LIYGAGDGGEMVLRELKNNPDWNRIPVGFIDDDPLKKGKVIHGLQVFDANGTLASVCSSKNVAEILISIREFSPAKLEAVKELCRRSEIELRRAEIKIEPVDID
jgi:UDP-GlcNAc:undecaprenyl-phosphate GlcNAc-1-phosphate transferase